VYRFTHSEDRNVQEQPQKRSTSAVSLVPKFTFVLIVQTCTWGQRPKCPRAGEFLHEASWQATYTYRTHTYIHVLTLSSGTQDRLCGPAHRVLHSSALCPDEGVSDKAQTGELDPGVQRQRCVFVFLFFNFQGAKHLLIHTIEQPEYCHFKLHNSEKRRGFPIIFTYIHTYPNNLNLFEDEIQCIVCFTCMKSVASSCLTSLLHLLYIRCTMEVQYD